LQWLGKEASDQADKEVGAKTFDVTTVVIEVILPINAKNRPDPKTNNHVLSVADSDT
jgi:hypothetical protein